MKSAGNWIKKKSHRVGHFRTKVRKCPSRVRNGLDTSEPLFGSVPAVVDTSEPLFGSVLHIHTWFNLRPKLPSRCVVLGSWSIYFFGCCLVNYCGGLIR